MIKSKKKFLKKEKSTIRGITLIALVITIIILLILAGISIMILTGKNGILEQATKAQEENRYKKAEEKVKLAVMGSYDTSNELDTIHLKNNLNNIDGIDPKVEEISFNLMVTVDGYNFIITKLGKVKSQRDGGILAPTITHEITPEENTKTSVEIKIIAEYGQSGILSIQKPDGTIENSNTTTYTVTENGDYTFIIKDSDNNDTTYTVTITNIMQDFYLYNRGVSSCGTFTDYHNGNGSGNIVNGDSYLEIYTKGVTGRGGAHNVVSTENVGATGFKNMHIVYDVVDTTYNGKHNDCRQIGYGISKKQQYKKYPSVGSYTDVISLEDIPDYGNYPLHISLRADWSDESLRIRVYEIYLTY